jgi:hypothetical protein
LHGSRVSDHVTQNMEEGFSCVEHRLGWAGPSGNWTASGYATESDDFLLNACWTSQVKQLSMREAALLSFTAEMG